MKKHYFVPLTHSFFRGESKVVDYKCKYCGKVRHSAINIKEMSKKDAICIDSSLSSSTIAENILQVYDCSSNNKNIDGKIQDIKIEVQQMTNNIKKKMKKGLVYCYITTHFIVRALY